MAKGLKLNTLEKLRVRVRLNALLQLVEMRLLVVKLGRFRAHAELRRLAKSDVSFIHPPQQGESVLNTFVWHDTPQGFRFWNNLHNGWEKLNG